MLRLGRSMPWQGETYEYRRFAGQVANGTLMQAGRGMGYDKVLSGHILARQTKYDGSEMGDGIKGQGITGVSEGFARECARGGYRRTGAGSLWRAGVRASRDCYKHYVVEQLRVAARFCRIHRRVPHGAFWCSAPTAFRQECVMKPRRGH